MSVMPLAFRFLTLLPMKRKVGPQLRFSTPLDMGVVLFEFRFLTLFIRDPEVRAKIGWPCP
jgi:hypothetical protein